MWAEVKTILTEYQDELTLVAKEEICSGVVSLRLRRRDGAELPHWAAGAHIDLKLGNGCTRQYSLCGDPGVINEFRVCVLNEQASRGGSRYVHEELSVGDVVPIKGPRNNFTFAPAQRYLFIAGGIGITPIYAMVAAADKLGADWHLAYGGRSRSSMAFLEELINHGDKVTVTAADEGAVIDLDHWLESPRADTLVYCCGPEGLMSAVEERCASWPHGALHLERFKPIAIADGVDGAFDVELRRSGVTVNVPADKSILKAIQDKGLIVPCSCEEGTCGTCETNVIEGIPDHRDSVLSASEKESGRVIMICVSRCKSQKLVLDL